MVIAPSWRLSLTAAATCLTAGSPSLLIDTLVDPSAPTHSVNLMTACGSAAPFLSTAIEKIMPDILSFATGVGVASPAM